MPGFQPSKQTIRLYPKASPWAELYQPFRPQNIKLNLNQRHFLLLPSKNWVLTQNAKGFE